MEDDQFSEVTTPPLKEAEILEAQRLVIAGPFGRTDINFVARRAAANYSALAAIISLIFCAAGVLGLSGFGAAKAWHLLFVLFIAPSAATVAILGYALFLWCTRPSKNRPDLHPFRQLVLSGDGLEAISKTSCRRYHWDQMHLVSSRGGLLIRLSSSCVPVYLPPVTFADDEAREALKRKIDYWWTEAWRARRGFASRPFYRDNPLREKLAGYDNEGV